MATLRTRNLKVQCDGCAYSVYTTRKWLAAYGAPLRSLSTTLRHPWVGFSEHLLVVAPRTGAG